MKSSYATDLNSVNIKSNSCICILSFMNLAKLTRGFKWHLEIKVINLMSYFFSNNVILWLKKTGKKGPMVEIFFDS